MKKLSAELDNIKLTAEQITLNKNTSSMQVPGLIAEAGRMTTQSLQAQKTFQRQSVHVSHADLRQDQTGRKKLKKIIHYCFQILDTFGKEPEQLESIVHAFTIFLGDYKYPDIENAFKEYIKNNTTMPKPANIIDIINARLPLKSNLTERQEKRRQELMKKYQQV